LESDGLKSYGQLSGNVDHAKQYTEFSAADLELELAMYAVTKVSDTTEIFQQFNNSRGQNNFSNKLKFCFDYC